MIGTLSPPAVTIRTTLIPTPSHPGPRVLGVPPGTFLRTLWHTDRNRKPADPETHQPLRPRPPSGGAA
jgi:hypothetical protein